MFDPATLATGWVVGVLFEVGRRSTRKWWATRAKTPRLRGEPTPLDLLEAKRKKDEETARINERNTGLRKDITNSLDALVEVYAPDLKESGIFYREGDYNKQNRLFISGNSKCEVYVEHTYVWTSPHGYYVDFGDSTDADAVATALFNHAIKTLTR